MSINPEAPRLSGTFGVNNHLAAESPAPDVLLSGDLARLRTEGTLRPEEYNAVYHPSGKAAAVLYGDCLPDASAIEAALDASLRGRPTSLAELPGSYTALLFEPDQLTAMADLAGKHPLFYRSDQQGGLSFSSLTKPLRRERGDAFDPLVAASNIALPVPTDIIAGRSAIAGIERLDGGHMLKADRHGNTQITPYETFQTPTVASMEEAAEKLRAALLEAVGSRARLGRKITAAFSGGRDSTSAAFLLAQALRDPLKVITGYSRDIQSDDLDHARRYASLPESRGYFDHHEYEMDTRTFMYDGLLHAPSGDEPNLSTARYAYNAAFAQYLKRLGSEIHVEGSAADEALLVEPHFYLSGLLRTGQYLRFGRSLMEVARIGVTSPIELFGDVKLRGQVDPAAHWRIISELLAGSHDPDALKYGGFVFQPNLAPQWLTRNIRRELSDLALSHADMVPRGDYDLGNYFAYSNVRNAGLAEHSYNQQMANLGDLRKHAIYLDGNVLRACFSLPAHERDNPWVFKELLARAVKGLVPDAVSNRSTKGEYSRHVGVGLRAADEQLRTLLRDSRLVEARVLDRKAVRHSLDTVQMRGQLPTRSLRWFAAYETWLRSQESSQGGHYLPPPPAPSVSKPLTAVELLPHDSRYGMPKDTSITTHDTGAFVFNLHTAGYYRLGAESLAIIKALQAGGTVSAALSLLHSAYPDLPKNELEVGVAQSVRTLTANGILAENGDTFSIAEAPKANVALSPAFTRQAKEAANIRLRDYPAALGGFVLTLALKNRPFEQQVRFLERLQRRWARKPEADMDRARSLLMAVKRVSAPYLGRAACQEHTVATVFGAALMRRKLPLVLGLQMDSDEKHSWTEVQGVPILTATDPEVLGVFVPVFRT
jgi:asparagine synthase (glutamine-hydrolysing)